MTERHAAPRRTNDSQLARLRMERGLTQGQLAKKVGCRQKDVSRWESGTKPGAAYLIKISGALDCTVDELLK